MEGIGAESERPSSDWQTAGNGRARVSDGRKVKKMDLTFLLEKTSQNPCLRFCCRCCQTIGCFRFLCRLPTGRTESNSPLSIGQHGVDSRAYNTQSSRVFDRGHRTLPRSKYPECLETRLPRRRRWRRRSMRPRQLWETGVLPVSKEPAREGPCYCNVRGCSSNPDDVGGGAADDDDDAGGLRGAGSSLEEVETSRPSSGAGTENDPAGSHGDGRPEEKHHDTAAGGDDDDSDDGDEGCEGCGSGVVVDGADGT